MRMDKSEIKKLPDCKEGLENKIKAIIKDNFRIIRRINLHHPAPNGSIYKESVELTFVHPVEGCGRTL